MIAYVMLYFGLAMFVVFIGYVGPKVDDQAKSDKEGERSNSSIIFQIMLTGMTILSFILACTLQILDRLPEITKAAVPVITPK